MAQLPSVPGVKVVKALERAGFAIARISGSHHILRHPDGRSVTVPVHQGRDLPKGNIANILAITGLSPQDLARLV
jgi:predicted RNA binding protein YcfA (HicA-like mRNA interferase family)